MSTTTSPQPPKSGLSPFKEENPFDPYLPSASDDEHLTEIPSDHNSPEDTSLPDSHSKSASGEARSGQDAASSIPRRLSSRPEEGFGPVERIDSYGYGGLEGFEPQGFDNTLLLESNFGPLPAPEDFNDMTFFRQSSFRRTDTGRTEEPLSAATSKATDISRRSTGIATHSSQLMSPVLTDIASPDYPSDDPRSPNRTKLLGGGAEMARASSSSTAATAVAVTPSKSLGIAQRTPALTTSSKDVSPNLGVQQHAFLEQMPAIQVDYHKRGDSPAGIVDSRQGLNKRRRGSQSSSLLAAHSAQGIEEQEDEAARAAGSRLGLGPQARGEAAVSSLEEQQEGRALSKKNNDVSAWLTASLHEGLPENPNRPVTAKQHLSVQTGNTSRRRAVSNSNPSDLPADAWGFSRGLQANSHSRTPGPGVLINEDSGDEDVDMDDESVSFVESAPPSINGNEAAVKAEELDRFPAFEDLGPAPQEAHPWIDPIYMPGSEDSRAQPETANAAMMRFMKRAHDIETASRVATWGTIARRKSDGDMQDQMVDRVFGSDGLFSRLSISRSRDKTEKEKDEWRNFKDTVQQAADRILPKRANSNAKRKTSEPRPSARESVSYDSGATHKRKESSASLGSRSSGQTLLSRIPSTKRPKSPRINTSTSGIAAAMATQVGALGVHGGLQPASPPSPVGWRAFKESAKGRFGFNSKPGSPEAARLASPPLATIPQPAPAPPVDMDEDADGDEAVDEQGITMDMAPSHVHIIPTFEGFKAHVRETSPRLPEYLVERLGQEQLRRYKKLVNAKVEHTKARELGNCGSARYCADRGGQPTYFPAKNAQKELSHTGFSAAGTGEEDEDEEAVADGIVSEAQFPPGLPMPPAKRLPAEFECPLCFTVKKFQKPSDWSKHVHEDLQPFTCTFRQCPEPKSFKRKADWVRHENERHRQLEWWQCSEEGCSHLCYRRDNFVQHLVREHKMPEPKAKNAPRPNKPAVRGPAKGKVKVKGGVSMADVPAEERVLHMVEICRRETQKNPMDEPCRFCGNHCNSFKKLTVHLARHMENLSLPVLELVRAKDVSADTIISPIDVKLTQQGGISPVDAQGFATNLDASPYNPAMDLGGMVPLASAAFQQQQSAYQQMWGGAAAATSHMQQPGTAAYVAEPAWPATGPMFGQPYGAYSAAPPYVHPHHASLPSPELYAMSAGAASSGSPPLPAAPAFHIGPDGQQQRPQFHTPHYLAHGAATNGVDGGIPAAQDDLGLQYGGANQAYTQDGMYGGDQSNGQGQYYGY